VQYVNKYWNNWEKVKNNPEQLLHYYIPSSAEFYLIYHLTSSFIKTARLASLSLVLQVRKQAQRNYFLNVTQVTLTKTEHEFRYDCYVTLLFYTSSLRHKLWFNNSLHFSLSPILKNHLPYIAGPSGREWIREQGWIWGWRIKWFVKWPAMMVYKEPCLKAEKSLLNGYHI
jgi:hypothetical protein